MWNKLFRERDVESYEMYHQEEPTPPAQEEIPPIRAVHPQPQKVVHFEEKAKKQEILSVKLEDYASTGEVARYIKDRKPIIVNMQNLNDKEVQRALDYLSGVSYALDASVELLTTNIYVMLPAHIELHRD
ncbi:MAG: hypothetical protein BEN18_01745 [Epulopiscium sp. Nuni2H_MBin001]|nr:MAG: hypothetical protein BEN18_01745 [Epulopiscium sp. Nuni2H_MBin001]